MRITQGKLRTLVRCLAFPAALLLLAGLLPWPEAARVVPAASPFVAIATALATATLGLSALFALPVLAFALFRRRWFCRWACPVGLMTECAGSVSPVSPSRCKPAPRLGMWLALLSLSAAVAGYPLLLWLDPLALFSGTLGLATGDATSSACLTATALVCILVLSFVLPGAWCLKLCPLGATQELLARPWAWFRRRKGSEPAALVGEDLVSEPVSRRNVLAVGIGGTLALAGVPLGLAARDRQTNHHGDLLRPPGAVPEWQFGQLCLRCGNCVRACPSEIIISRWDSGTWSTWLAPEISFVSDYCREDCTACLQACPSGALRNSRNEAETKPPIGLAHVLMDRCLLALGRECRTMCLDACPYDALTLHEWTWEDDRRYPIVATEKCPGCGACQVACTPMNAIVVKRED